MSSLEPEMIRWPDCARAFHRIFWAFLFFIDFRIGINNVHVDILPDFIGWILMASALGWIIDVNPRVRGLRTLSFWLVVLSIFGLVEVRKPLQQVKNLTVWVMPTFLISVVAGILAIIFIWRLCGVIMDLASALDNTTIRNRADFRRKLYLGIIIAIWVVGGIIYVFPPFIIAAFIIGLPASILVFCLMMGLMKGTENMCRGVPV